MYAERQIGCYNVTINDGQLDNETNTWYYIMAIDKFDIGDDWEESKHYYIKGHKDGDSNEEEFITHAVHLWLNSLIGRDISEIFIMYPNGYKFKIAEPQLVKLA